MHHFRTPLDPTLAALNRQLREENEAAYERAFGRPRVRCATCPNFVSESEAIRTPPQCDACVMRKDRA